MAPESAQAHSVSPYKGFWIGNGPNPEDTNKREDIKKRDKNNSYFFPHMFFFFLMNSHCLSLKTSHSFKTVFFSLKAAHTLLLTDDLQTNTSLQMHCQGKQAMHAFSLSARSPSHFNHLLQVNFVQWLSQNEHFSKSNQSQHGNVFTCIYPWQTAPKCSSKEPI